MKLATTHILTSLTPIIVMGVAAVVVFTQILNFEQKEFDEKLHNNVELVTHKLEEYLHKVAQVTDSMAHRQESLDSVVEKVHASVEVDFFNAYVSDAHLDIMVTDITHRAQYRSWDPLAQSDIVAVDQQGASAGKLVRIDGDAEPHFAVVSNIYTADNKILGELLVAVEFNEKFVKSLIVDAQDSLRFGFGPDILGTIGTFDPDWLRDRVTSKIMPGLWVEISRDGSSTLGQGLQGTVILSILLVTLAGTAFLFQWRSTSRNIIQPLKKIHSVIVNGAVPATVGYLPQNEIGTIGIAIINQKFDLEQKVLVIRSITEQLQKDASMIKVLSHDIATPLTVIKAATQMLKKKVSPDDVVSHDLIRRLGVQSKTVEQILGHVRDMKALETGKRRLDLHDVRFGDVLNELHEAFEDRLSEKGLTLNWDKADDAVTFVADAISFRISVLSNLVSNAIKFSTRGGRIDVSCREIDGMTRLEVRDYGAGIPQNIRAHIFSSTHATTRAGSEGESGTGFGMPLVKFYMDLYGGKIDFSTKLISESATDHGTTFSIFLPTKLIGASKNAA